MPKVSSAPHGPAQAGPGRGERSSRLGACLPVSPSGLTSRLLQLQVRLEGARGGGVKRRPAIANGMACRYPRVHLPLTPVVPYTCVCNLSPPLVTGVCWPRGKGGHSRSLGLYLLMVAVLLASSFLQVGLDSASRGREVV